MKAATFSKALIVIMALAAISAVSSVASPKSNGFFIKSAQAETNTMIESSSSDSAGFSSDDLKYLLKGL